MIGRVCTLANSIWYSLSIVLLYYCNIVFTKHGDFETFVATVVNKTRLAEHMTQIFTKENQNKLYSINIKYLKFTRKYLFNTRTNSSNTY